MKDPDRLLDADRSALARRMLSAAREESPSDAALERTVAALGVGAVVLGASATAGIAASGATTVVGLGGGALSGAAKVVPSSLLFGAAKWLGIGAMSGLVTAGVAGSVATLNAPAQDAAPAALAPRDDSQARPLARARSSTLPASELPDEPVRGEEQSPRAAEVVEAAVPTPRAARSNLAPSEDSVEVAARQARLAAEVEAVDRAREAVARGDSARALAALETYERNFAEQRLRPEALFLRMEALLRRGDVAGARTAARAVLAADPRGPHAARAREVLSVAP